MNRRIYFKLQVFATKWTAGGAGQPKMPVIVTTWQADVLASQFYDDKIQGSMAVAMHAACVTRESARRAMLLSFFTGW
jgi:hypothetical protein